MAWYDEAVFYHIYPLGLCGAPRQNAYEEPVHRLKMLTPWISHIRNIGCNAIYIGPLFESVGHGYETTDYKKLDSRLGTNEDLKAFVAECHRQGVRVIFDGVFNHTGRDFFAFQDLKRNRENSPYKDWYCNVNFWGNNEYNDGFSYDNWGGYNLLVKLNQWNPDVQNYIADVVRFWVTEFDVDGIRLDAADVLDFGFMRMLRQVANSVKPDFWLMGEVIHGDYIRWANADTLHSVTNYHLHKALYSGHNDHNYFEIAHTVRRLNDMGGRGQNGLKLYNFVDNHDVERIFTKLRNKDHFVPTHCLLYTLPGIPSVYYGSEFGIEGRKERGSDDSLRPALDLDMFKDAVTNNLCTSTVSKLGHARQQLKALAYGSYTEHVLTTGQYAYSRNCDGQNVLVTVNNADNSAQMNLPANGIGEYVGVLTGRTLYAQDGNVFVEIPANSGEVWVPAGSLKQSEPTADSSADSSAEQNTAETTNEQDASASFSFEDVMKAAGTLVESAAEKLADKKETISEKADAFTEKISEKAEQIKLSEKADAFVEKIAEKADKLNLSEKTEQLAQKAGKFAEEVAEPAKSVMDGLVKAIIGSVEAVAEPIINAAKKAVENEAAQKAESVQETETEQTETEQTETAQTEPVQAESDKPLDLEHRPMPENKSYEEMTVEELQKVIYEKMKKNGPVTDRMRQDIEENVYHNSLVNWAKSFR